jgi:hypothetical protein
MNVDSGQPYSESSSDSIIIGDYYGVAPWASSDYVTIFDFRVLSGDSLNVDIVSTDDLNCFLSVGVHPQYCLACTSYVLTDA